MVPKFHFKIEKSLLFLESCNTNFISSSWLHLKPPILIMWHSCNDREENKNLFQLRMPYLIFTFKIFSVHLSHCQPEHHTVFSSIIVLYSPKTTTNSISLSLCVVTVYERTLNLKYVKCSILFYVVTFCSTKGFFKRFFSYVSIS